MIWFFERGAETIELETRYSQETDEFVLELRGPGVVDTERFTDGDEFRTRLVTLERSLGVERWRPNGPPLMLPDGWPRGKPPQ